ncbi:MAG: hypothetical protein CVU87_09515 [Firmicutes bacterium HGW-Firmicutes-12]|nr:MAG: hypothetical protein CVU87_09515 [Firmicutes bacterium HGW-Firmicutes-12]
MISNSYTIAMLIKVFFVFCFLYIFIPSRVISFDKDADKFWDKFFISLVHSTIITILIVHVLAFLKLYDTFSLIFSYLVVYILVIKTRGKSWFAVLDGLGLKLVVHLLNISEGRTGFIGESRWRIKAWIRRLKNDIRAQVKKSFQDPFYGILPIVVVMGGVFIRFRHAIFNATFTASDTYGHLAWSKFIGNNQIYQDGIYSYGLHSCISALNKIFFIDPYWLCRFIGPLSGVIIFLSVYYISLRFTKNHAASLIAAVVYGLVTNGDFPSVVSRQTALLSQEYASMFVLPGLYFLWLFFSSGKRKYLYLFAEALAITFFVHPYATVFLGLWSGILMIVTIFMFREFKKRLIVDYIFFSFIACSIALLPFGVGLLMGKKFFGTSASYIRESITFEAASINITDYFQLIITQNFFIYAAMLIIAFLAICLIFKFIKGLNVPIVTIALATLFTVLQYHAPQLQLPALTDPFRTGMFLALLLPVVYASGFNCIFGIITSFKKLEFFKNALFKTAVIIVCVALVYVYPPGKLTAMSMEYEAAVLNYLVIERDFEPLDWTIIAPTEQFQEALGVGYHYEILRFVQDLTPYELADPDFELPIPTHNIFLYTEKVPFHLNRRITDEDADRELEPEGNNPFEQFYHGDGEQRGIIQAKAVRLIEAYKSTHDNVEIFYEDENMTIYHIYHEPDLEKFK